MSDPDRGAVPFSPSGRGVPPVAADPRRAEGVGDHGRGVPDEEGGLERQVLEPGDSRVRTTVRALRQGELSHIVPQTPLRT